MTTRGQGGMKMQRLCLNPAEDNDPVMLSLETVSCLEAVLRRFLCLGLGLVT